MKRLRPGNAILRFLFICQVAIFSGCADKSVDGDAGIEGLGKFTYSVANGRASLTVVFENLHIDQGATIPLSRPEGAYVELGPDVFTAGTIFMISVPIQSLFQGNGDLPRAGLPDGRPLPGINNGVLGALVVNLPLLGLTYLYLGEDVFGIFFPISLPNLPWIVTVKIRDEMGNLLGILSGIPKGKKGAISGALFLFPVEGSGSAKVMNRVL